MDKRLLWTIPMSLGIVAGLALETNNYLSGENGTRISWGNWAVSLEASDYDVAATREKCADTGPGSSRIHLSEHFWNLRSLTESTFESEADMPKPCSETGVAHPYPQVISKPEWR